MDTASNRTTRKDGDGMGNEVLLAGFLRALEREGLAPSSREKYGKHVGQFLAWLGDRHPRDVERGEARLYLDDIGADRVRLAALKRFYGFLRERDLLIDSERRERPSPFENARPDRREQREPDPLTEEEERRLLTAPMNGQERFLAYLLRYSGLRISEAAGLKVKDVEFNGGRGGRGQIRVRESKTAAGRRTVPIDPVLEPELRVCLHRLQEEHGERFGPELPVLATRNGTPMKPQFAWRILKRVAVRAGVRVHTLPSGEKTAAISPHTLRRTFGSALLNRTPPVRLETVSKLLGHADVRVTQAAYARVLDARAHDEFYEAVGT